MALHSVTTPVAVTAELRRFAGSPFAQRISHGVMATASVRTIAGVAAAGMNAGGRGDRSAMALTLLRIDLPGDNDAVAVFSDADGVEVPVRIRLDPAGVAHAEEAFTEAYLSVPGPDVPQAHELLRLVSGLLLVRPSRLPNGDALASAWATVGDELEHDLALRQDDTVAF
jgi:hypothetical protein